MVGLVEEVFLNHPPVIPAYNKFTKITPPVIWFMVFCSMFSIFPRIVQVAVEALDEDGLELDIGADPSEAISVVV